MKRSIRALACAFVIGSVPILCGVPEIESTLVRDARADQAPPNVSECMNFRSDVQERSIVVRAKNGCEKKVTCTLSYVLRCADNHGKPLSKSAQSEHFALASDSSTELVLSAEPCQEAWSIDEVSWRCQGSERGVASAWTGPLSPGVGALSGREPRWTRFRRRARGRSWRGPS